MSARQDEQAVAEKPGRTRSKPRKKRSDAEPAVQAGARPHPQTLHEQRLSKSAPESQLRPQPQFMAPDYRGSAKLKRMSALITGGDSGIGRAVAVLFAREGADVAIIYLDEDEDAKETKRYVEAEGRQCLLLPGDVKDPAFCDRAVRAVVDTYGHLDVLVNNAAFQEHADELTDITEERFDETLRTNVYGYFHMAKAVLPYLGPGSSIINTGSVTGLRGSPKLLDYSTTKGAIHAFTKALAQNVLHKGIRVNAIAPGPVWTPLNPSDVAEGDMSEFGKNTDMHRAAQPEELSPAYVFLASPVCAGYITGIVLPITGSVGSI